jgi:hypothetical protein
MFEGWLKRRQWHYMSAADLVRPEGKNAGVMRTYLCDCGAVRQIEIEPRKDPIIRITCQGTDTDGKT